MVAAAHARKRQMLHQHILPKRAASITQTAPARCPSSTRGIAPFNPGYLLAKPQLALGATFPESTPNDQFENRRFRLGRASEVRRHWCRGNAQPPSKGLR